MTHWPNHINRMAWTYLRQELFYLIWAITEIALITPFALSLMGWARYWPPGQVALWLLCLLLLPFNLIRLMTLLHVPQKQQQTLMAIILLSMIFLSLRFLVHPQQTFLGWVPTFFQSLGHPQNRIWARDLYIFSLVIIVWWRGLRITNLAFTIEHTGRRLRNGGLLAAPIAIAFARDYLSWDVTPFLLLFFAAILTAVALIRAEQIEQQTSGLSAPLTWRWSMTIGLTVFSLVFTAGTLAAIISGEATELILGWLAPLWRALHFTGLITLIIVSYLFVPFMILLSQTLTAIINFIGRLADRTMGFISETGFGLGIERLSQLFQPAEETTVTVDPSLPNIGQRIITLLIMLAIVLIVTLLVRVYHHRTTDMRSVTEANTASTDSMTPPPLIQRLLSHLGLLPKWWKAASVRRLYQQMCRAAAAAGYPRTAAETPNEYNQTLAKVWPHHTTEITLITQAYIRVRYGQLPESKTELEKLQQAWRQLEITPPNNLT